MTFDREVVPPLDDRDNPSTVNAFSYSSGRRRTRVVITVFGLGIILSIAMMAHDISEYKLAERARNNDQITAAEIERNDYLQQILGIAWLVWSLAAIVAFLMWTHRMHRNLPALGATDLKFTPRGAVGWYFAPFLNLFKPYQCMREIHNASDPSGKSGRGSDWHRHAPPSVKIWWTLFLLMNLVSKAVARARYYADSPGALQFVDAASVIDDTVTILAMSAVIWLVSSVDRRQDVRANSLGIS